MGEDLYTHYLCIQTKMMMLTPLDGQIATPNHIFAQNDVFFRGVGSVCDKGGVLQLGCGGVYNLAVRISFSGRRKKRQFFLLTSNTGCSKIIIRNTIIMSGL